nr:exopolyphosphatase [Deltaproteobacteria bacterium]
YRNSMTVILTGLDIDKKARILEEALFDSIGGREQFKVCSVQLIRSDKEDPATNEEAFAYLRITVLDPDQKKVDKISSKVVELALANIPGFAGTAPPAKGTPAIVYWPALVSSTQISQKVVVEEQEFFVEATLPPEGFSAPEPLKTEVPPVPGGNMVKVPFGRVFATRSGDKGGNANLGVWARTPGAYAFLREFLSTERLKGMLHDLEPFEIERYELPNLLALNFYIKGILGEGAAASLRLDAQAKTLGEYLRARVVELPASIVPA